MTAEEILRETKGFLLDLDGTVYLDGVPIKNAVQTLRKLRSMGKKLVFLTNNSSKTAEEYRRRLLGSGLFGEGDLVYTSANEAARYFAEHAPSKRVFMLATDAVKREFACAGVQVCEEEPDMCLLAYDTGITYEKICKFDGFLKRGLPYFATHSDDVCPAKGTSVPDAGSFLALFERSSGRRPEHVFGKPDPGMAAGAARMTGLSVKDLCMIGDRTYTDIRFANNCGMKSVLVLSGETKREALGSIPDKPDLVLLELDGLVEGISV